MFSSLWSPAAHPSAAASPRWGCRSGNGEHRSMPRTRRRGRVPIRGPRRRSFRGAAQRRTEIRRCPRTKSGLRLRVNPAVSELICAAGGARSPNTGELGRGSRPPRSAYGNGARLNTSPQRLRFADPDELVDLVHQAQIGLDLREHLLGASRSACPVRGAARSARADARPDFPTARSECSTRRAPEVRLSSLQHPPPDHPTLKCSRFIDASDDAKTHYPHQNAS